eukprot:gene1290-biopygen8798
MALPDASSTWGKAWAGTSWGPDAQAAAAAGHLEVSDAGRLVAHAGQAVAPELQAGRQGDLAGMMMWSL